MEVGKFYFAHVKDIRGCSGSINNDAESNYKYIYSYGSRVNERVILLKCISKNNDDFLVQEYYTNKNFVVFSHIELPHYQFGSLMNINNMHDIKKCINSIPTVAINLEDIKNINDELKKQFYMNYAENKESEIIEAINHVYEKGKNSIINTIFKIERMISFREYENAYFDNVIYDMQHNIKYIDKIKKR